MKVPCVYLLASKSYGTLYAGVTSDLHKRMSEHAQGLIEGFTKRHGVKRLVFYKMHKTMEAAIRREKQLKNWNRVWKIRLIEQMNPEWTNLFNEDTGEIAFGPAERERLDAEPVPNPDMNGCPPARA